jgi:hypothetical protein
MKVICIPGLRKAKKKKIAHTSKLGRYLRADKTKNHTEILIPTQAGI